jgi:NTE family protein
MDEIALALGGGGAKGAAHVGVVRVLEQEGIAIRAISGTSAGGLVGALVASGYDSFHIEDILSGISNPRLFSRAHHDGPSLLGLQGLSQIFLEEIGDKTFDQLEIPFACTAVDLPSSQEMILAQGCLMDALMATIAVPGIFPPFQFGEYQLVDGAVLDPVPVALARWLAPHLPIIAVCLHSSPEKWAHLPQRIINTDSFPLPRPILEQFAKMRFGQAFQIFVNSIDTTSRMLAELRMQQERPDVIIRPAVESFGLLDRIDPAELIQIGVEAATNALPEIRQAMKWSNQISRYFRKADPPGKVLPNTLE